MPLVFYRPEQPGLLTDGIGGYYFSYVVQQNNG